MDTTLSKTTSLRFVENVKKIQTVLKNCLRGNPFSPSHSHRCLIDPVTCPHDPVTCPHADPPLKNMATGAIVPKDIKTYILERDRIGEMNHQRFIYERLDEKNEDSTKSVWSLLKQVKLKSWRNLNKTVKVTTSDKKIIEIREERQLMTRMFLAAQSRGLDREEAIGDHEFSAVPRSLCDSTGGLHLDKDKSVLMSTLLGMCPGSSSTEPPVVSSDSVLLIDGMAVVNTIQKGLIRSFEDFRATFIRKIKAQSHGYGEVRVIFDNYWEDSPMKESTRKRRAGGKPPVRYDVNDRTSLKNISLKAFLGHTETKKDVIRQFCTSLLECWSSTTTICYVAYDNITRCSDQGLISNDMLTTNHDEADQLLPLHALDVIKRSTTSLSIHVICRDTDVFVLLVHLKAVSETPHPITILAGTISKPKNINIDAVVAHIGRKKSQALLGLHCFTEGDWGGKFFGVTKVRWLGRMLDRQDDDNLIRCLSTFGDDDEDLHEEWENTTLETFVIRVYAPAFRESSIGKLRYFLFRTKGTEGERLPPTKGALIQHIKRARVVASVNKNYQIPNPALPVFLGKGWTMSEGLLCPHMTDMLPAPQAVVELVKCGCAGFCENKRCSCFREGFSCCDICECGDTCRNDENKYGTDGIESDEETSEETVDS